MLVAAIFAAGCQSHSTARSEALPAATMTNDPSQPQASTPLNSRQAETIGTSVNGEPIVMCRYVSDQPDAPNVLIFAGIHGSEGTTVTVTRKFLDELDAIPRPLAVNLYIIPVANPDGYAAKTRVNTNKVDLNRNFPAKNFSTSQRKTRYWNGTQPLTEPESRALHDLVLRLKPARILAMHAIKAGQHGNNFDGPAQALAELMASKNGYNVLPTMGYDTPGSFGSWAGIDLCIPTITLELPSNVNGEAAWKQNREALWAFVHGE